MILKIALLIFIITISLLPAQDYHWNISLAHGDTLFSVSLLYFTGDYLLTATGAKTYWISVNSITKMIKFKKSKAVEGMGYGFLAGLVSGTLIGAVSYAPKKGQINLGPGASALGGGIVGSILGIAIGAIVGESAGKKQIYDLSQYTYEEKINCIRNLLL